MIRWTSAGAVEGPTSVQVRVSQRFSQRIAALAPVPSRPMTVAELADNLEWFAVTRAGPRAAGSTRAVLSGVEHLPGWEQVIPAARRWGLAEIVVHGPPTSAEVDRFVVVASEPGQVAAGADAIVPLDAAVLPRLAAIAAAAVAAPARRLVLTWPFPSEGAPIPPPADEVVAALVPAVERARAAGVPITVKGLPPCLLRDLPDGPSLASHTRNRWYVDADHQRDDALLFFPDVLRFARPDSCRHCAAAPRCDGVAERWLRQGMAGALVPFVD